jgi:hypothetical protein
MSYDIAVVAMTQRDALGQVFVVRNNAVQKSIL